jgi:hypothetical protein
MTTWPAESGFGAAAIDETERKITKQTEKQRFSSVGCGDARRGFPEKRRAKSNAVRANRRRCECWARN